MESFSSVKVLVLCEQLVTMNQNTLIMCIRFITNSYDATKVDATYHQTSRCHLLITTGICTKTNIGSLMYINIAMC